MTTSLAAVNLQKPIPNNILNLGYKPQGSGMPEIPQVQMPNVDYDVTNAAVGSNLQFGNNNNTNPSINTPQLSGWGKFSLAAQGIAGLLNAYNGYQQLGLMKDQYRSSIADRNQQIANQAKTTNLSLANQADMAAQMSGYSRGTPEYEQYIRQHQVQVDGSPIKG